jgi:transcription elongation factor Elf1
MEMMILKKEESRLVSSKKKVTKSILCSICQQELHNKAVLYQSAVNDRIICEKCYRRFSREDIELMINLFNAYGGYFGKFQKLKASVYKRIKELNGFKVRQDNLSNADSINLQLLHAALQFGFTPKEYFQGFLSTD